MDSISLFGGARAPASSHVVVLDGAADLRGAAALREQLLTALGAHAAVTVDTREATSFDAGAIQVLLAARLTAARSGKALSIMADDGGALPCTLARLGLAVDFA